MPNEYDETKDKVLSFVKVKGDREGFLIEVRSYKGAEPRIALTRYYATKTEGSEEVTWKKDTKTKYPRFSIRLAQWLIENQAVIDRGFSQWSKKESKDADDAF